MGLEIVVALSDRARMDATRCDSPESESSESSSSIGGGCGFSGRRRSGVMEIG